MTLQKNKGRDVKISVAAAEDLKAIWEYVSQHNENAASKLIKEIKNKFILLRDNPLVGREQNRFVVGLRSFVVKDYFIFYLPLDDPSLPKKSWVKSVRFAHFRRNAWAKKSAQPPMKN